ncbi:MAG: hypothetical protein AAGE94_05250 [Acidobacteriota bacterium]
MSKERVRETLSRPITPEFLERKLGEGWRPVAIEWERDAVGDGDTRVPVPYGLNIADDGQNLFESDAEMGVLRRILAGIVEDRPLSDIAAELNGHGVARRDGSPWTAPSIFELLPRVIEVAPSIYDSEAWQKHRPRLRSVG